MIIEKAQVVAVDGEYAVVQTERRGACGHCATREGCGVQLLDRLISTRVCRLSVLNKLDARVGDNVQIGIAEGSVVVGALLVYAVPLLFVLLALALAVVVFGPETSDLIAILSGLTGFFIGLITTRLYSRRLNNKTQYQTVLLSIEKDPSDSTRVVFTP